MLLHTWLPDTLRGAGIKVVETPGWRSRSHGQLPGTVRVVWHHDASPPGDSPGALNWMIANYPNSSANIWVDNYGTWFLVGTGVAWHAGKVLPGMPDNFDSIGIETDQTVGEAWPAAQLNSLRRGTAAIFARQNVPESWLHFHKTICDPPGRKQDPAGLDLAAERKAVAQFRGAGSAAPPTAKPPTTPPKDGNDMADITDAQMQKIAKMTVDLLMARTVRANKVAADGAETAANIPYGDTVGGTYTLAGRAAQRSL